MKLEKEVMIENSTLCYELKNGESKTSNGLEIKFLKKLNNQDFEVLNKIINSKLKLTLEVEEPILDEAERKYLSGVIKPFRNKVEYIIKYKSYDYKNKEYISIFINDSLTIALPYFKPNTMYKNMKLGKEYTLEDLEI